MNSDIFITVASWEERFWLGFEREMNQYSPANVLMYYYKEYAERTSSHREKVKQLCEKKGIGFHPYEVSFKEGKESWKILYETLTELKVTKKTITLDITTMPRETIWTILNLLDERDAEIKYIYYKPEGYHEEWLSRNADKPRIVYKMGGIAKLGVPTKLVILTGYDVDRVQQLIDFFEPEATFLGIQTGNQLDNQNRNIARHQKFKNEPDVILFDVDAYSEDRGFAAIEQQISGHVKHLNVIMSSLGPKLSAIALYKIHKRYPDTALAYAPSKEFNPEYSHGIGETVVGLL